MELYGEILAKRACLGGVKVVCLGSVDLLFVGHEDQRIGVRAVKEAQDLVTLLALLLVVSAQGLEGDLFEVALTRQHEAGGVILGMLLLLVDLHGVGRNDLGASGLAVFLFDLGQLLDDECLLLELVLERFLHVGDLGLEILDLGDAVDDILAVEVAQLDLGDIVCLDLVNAKALHQVGHNVGFLFGVANDANGLVDVEQDLAER